MVVLSLITTLQSSPRTLTFLLQLLLLLSLNVILQNYLSFLRQIFRIFNDLINLSLIVSDRLYTTFVHENSLLHHIKVHFMARQASSLQARLSMRRNIGSLFINRIFRPSDFTYRVISFLLFNRLRITPLTSKASTTILICPHIATHLTILLLFSLYNLLLFLILLHLLFLRKANNSQRRLQSTLLRINLRNNSRLAAITRRSILILRKRSNARRNLFLLNGLHFPSFTLSASFVYYRINGLIHLTICTSSKEGSFPHLFVGRIRGPSRITNLARIPLILYTRLISLMLIRLLFLTSRIKRGPRTTILVPTRERPYVRLRKLTTRDKHRFRRIKLTMVRRLNGITQLFGIFASCSPFLFRLLPISFALIGELMTFFALQLFLHILLFLFRIPFFLLFRVHLLSLYHLPFVLKDVRRVNK